VTRIKSLLIALVFATVALVATSAVHHLGEARAARLGHNGYVR
jgi:hypothetical protein